MTDYVLTIKDLIADDEILKVIDKLNLKDSLEIEKTNINEGIDNLDNGDKDKNKNGEDSSSSDVTREASPIDHDSLSPTSSSSATPTFQDFLSSGLKDIDNVQNNANDVINNIRTVNLKARGKDQNKIKEKKVRKTLLDDQRETNKKFNDKMEKNGSGYTCKLCGFATVILLKAKTHALSCGAKKKKPAKKVVECQSCDEKFPNKAKLNKHFQSIHQKSRYTCSKCGRTFKLWKSYTLHLKCHDLQYLARHKCTLCGYKARDKWLLQRHIGLKHSSRLITDLLNEILLVVSSTNKTPIENGENDEMDEVSTQNMEYGYGTTLDCNDVDTQFNNVVTNDHGHEDKVYEDYEDTNEDDFDQNISDEAIEQRSDISLDSDSENNDSFEANENMVDTDKATDNCVVRDSQNTAEAPRKLCRWEQIREDIIKERDELIAASKIMDEIKHAKEDLVAPIKLGKIKVGKIDKKQTIDEGNESSLRRSDRIKTNHDHKDRSERTITNYDNNDNHENEIKIEIKIEMLDSEDSQENQIISEVEINDSLCTGMDEIISQNETVEIAAVVENANNHRSEENNNGEIIDIIEGAHIDRISDKADHKVRRRSMFKCDKCNYATIDNYHLKRHNEIHEVTPIQCLRCKRICETKYEFQQHSLNCFYTCPYIGCSKKFKINYKFEAHKRNHSEKLRRMI